MDGTNAKIIEKITDRRTDDILKTRFNNEKEKVIVRLEKVLHFLKGAQIKEENLTHLIKPVDELEYSLKYIPNGPLFNDVIPTELKDNILSYLCESNAFTVASVCQDWKKILEKRFTEKKVVIGEECINCEGGRHDIQPVDIIKAAATHKLDVHLWIDEPVREVDSSLIVDALTSVSKFTIVNTSEYPVLSDDQLEHLFENIEKGDRILEEVSLLHLDLRGLNKERLTNCLFNKIKRLTMYEDIDANVTMLDAETFIKKLQQNANKTKLTHLDLDFQNYFDGLPPQNVADTLCNVENLKLCDKISSTGDVMVQLVKNILQRTVIMKSLIVVPWQAQEDQEYIDDLLKAKLYDFGSLINPQDLKALFNKMENVKLEGLFTLEQLDAVRSVTDVEISRVNYSNGVIFSSIKKGSDEMF